MDNEKELDNLIKQVVIAGYTPEEARNMSISDAILVCDCFKERMKIEKQIRAYYDFVLGQVIAMNIWGTKDKKPVPLDKVYPDLFGDTPTHEQTEEDRQRIMESKKASFMMLTHEIEKGMKAGGSDDGKDR